MIPYQVRKIGAAEGKDFIRRHHYSKTCHNGPMTWGLYHDDLLLGCIAFATPCSEAVRASVFGKEHVDKVTELHRLVILDGTPKNTESWFISRALRQLLEYRPNLRAVVSFADLSEGHRGIIYQASNALYCGTTRRARFWRDSEGRLRHPRQGGVNLSPQIAEERGWVSESRAEKHRYLFLVGDKKWARTHLKLEVLPYPKDKSASLTLDSPASVPNFSLYGQCPSTTTWRST